MKKLLFIVLFFNLEINAINLHQLFEMPTSSTMFGSTAQSQNLNSPVYNVFCYKQLITGVVSLGVVTYIAYKQYCKNKKKINSNKKMRHTFKTK